MAPSHRTLAGEITKGLLVENPVARLILGICSSLAVTNTVINGLAMGLAVIFVTVASSALVSMVRKVVPGGVRIATYIVIISGFVTLADLFLRAFFPDISKTLGPYVPLIVVNCIIMARAEVFAAKYPVVPSIADAIGMGAGYTWVLLAIGAVREILGSGTILGYTVLSEKVFTPWTVMVLPPGAFLTLGFLIGLINYVTMRRARKTR
ncbi:MAG: electron transport complex subunit RsxE [Deltaproteobacteria bacterium]|nr:electron transport complex subunit RsxE [Deltaproteobacteria bacterium]